MLAGCRDKEEEISRIREETRLWKVKHMEKVRQELLERPVVGHSPPPPPRMRDVQVVVFFLPSSLPLSCALLTLVCISLFAMTAVRVAERGLHSLGLCDFLVESAPQQTEEEATNTSVTFSNDLQSSLQTEFAAKKRRLEEKHRLKMNAWVRNELPRSLSLSLLPHLALPPYDVFLGTSHLTCNIGLQKRQEFAKIDTLVAQKVKEELEKRISSSSVCFCPPYFVSKQQPLFGLFSFA